MMSASPPTRRGSGRGLGGQAVGPTTPVRPLPREDLPTQSVTLSIASTHDKNKDNARLSPDSERVGERRCTTIGPGSASPSRPLPREDLPEGR